VKISVVSVRQGWQCAMCLKCGAHRKALEAKTRKGKKVIYGVIPKKIPSTYGDIVSGGNGMRTGTRGGQIDVDVSVKVVNIGGVQKCSPPVTELPPPNLKYVAHDCLKMW